MFCKRVTIFGWVFLILSCISCLDTRTRPSNLPLNAEWIGGIDGGVWVAFQGKNSMENFCFHVYTESGMLWVDDCFELTADCTFLIDKELTSQINAFDGQRLLLKGKNLSSKSCYFTQPDSIQIIDTVQRVIR